MCVWVSVLHHIANKFSLIKLLHILIYEREDLLAAIVLFSFCTLTRWRNDMLSNKMAKRKKYAAQTLNE